VAELSEDSSVEWEAAQWVARQMGDEPFDQESFDAWLAGDPRRKPLFEKMWQSIMGPRMDRALDAFAQRRRANRSLLTGSVVAALVLTGGYMALPSLEFSLAQAQEYTAAEGTIRKVLLEDGTRLTLAGGADVRVRYTSHVRNVELARGTIFADVAHDMNRPFRIDTDKGEITDLGTRFEVAKKPTSLRVTVQSGAVRFGTRGWFGKQIALTADQTAILSGTELNRAADAKADEIARWRTGWVEYRDVPMSQVVKDLESVSPLPIKIANKDLAFLRVSGRIQLSDPLAQINNLSVIHNFSVEEQRGEIIISRHVQNP